MGNQNKNKEEKELKEKEFRVNIQRFYRANGSQVMKPFISTPIGQFSLTGKDEIVSIGGAVGGQDKKVKVHHPNSEQLKFLYDRNPNFRKYIIAPDAYKAPWENQLTARGLAIINRGVSLAKQLFQGFSPT